MVKETKREKKTAVLAIIVGCALLLAVAALGVRSGWFNERKIVVGEEYLGEFIDYISISAEDYEGLIEKKDSFILLVDQYGCNAADTMRGFVKDWAMEKKIQVLKIMFSEMKETSLHEYVKYYPSVVIISEGEVIGYLRADSDEDSEMFNNYEEFKSWIEKYF